MHHTTRPVKGSKSGESLSKRPAAEDLRCSAFRFGSLSGRALRTAEKFLMPLELNLPGGGIAPPVLPDKSKGGRPRVSSAAFVFAESLRKALFL